MNRRTFLKLPVLLPLTTFAPALHSGEHHFQYEGVIGTSMDLVIWTANPRVAEAACRTVLQAIDRLASILNTRDPTSEICRLERRRGRKASRELADVFDAYDCWESRTGGIFSIRPGGPATAWNVDALGKAYILDRASDAVRKTSPSIRGLLINIGGDIVTWGPACEIAIADPDAWYDNAAPITAVVLRNAAVATSGTYARGFHLIDARTAQSITVPTAATVIASDAVAANALAATLCLMEPDDGLRLVESITHAEALRVASGVLQRSSGFARLELPLPAQTPPATAWPAGYHLTVTLPLKAGRSTKRPYVAVWVEDPSGKLVRILAVWGNKYKYYPDLSMAWSFLQRNSNELRSVTRATRPAGKYELEWDGLDNERKPVPFGTYRITVETNQEHGSYAKQTGTINVGESPATITLPATTNFDEVLVRYGPR